MTADNIDNIEKNSEEISGKGKIVNLCEDMNFHEHDEKSYERMKKVQDLSDLSKEKNSK